MAKSALTAKIHAMLGARNAFTAQALAVLHEVSDWAGRWVEGLPSNHSGLYYKRMLEGFRDALTAVLYAVYACLVPWWDGRHMSWFTLYLVTFRRTAGSFPGSASSNFEAYSLQLPRRGECYLLHT